MSMSHAWSLRDRIFGMIAYNDVELAETFIHRCQDTNSVVDINHFFRITLSQLPVDTRVVRAELDDHLDVDRWLKRFQLVVLPLLMQERFPEDTRRECPAFYFAPHCA